MHLICYLVVQICFLCLERLLNFVNLQPVIQRATCTVIILNQASTKMKSNPFIKNSQWPFQPPRRMLDQALGQPTNFNFSSNEMRPNPDQENINGGNIMPTHQASFSNLRLFEIINRRNESINHINQAEPASMMNLSNSKFEVTVKINLSPFHLQEVHPISSFNKLNRQNIPIVTPPQKVVELMIGCLKLTGNKKNEFFGLFQIIKGNNQQILTKIKELLNPSKKLIWTHIQSHQRQRLMYGLLFYQPVCHQEIQLFQKAMNNHQLGQLVSKVSKFYILDYLKAFYVVRQVHSIDGPIKYSSQSFMEIQPQKIMPEQKVFDLAKKFIEIDKNSLFDCYLYLIKHKKRPSDYNICQIGHDYEIVWANISNMEKESPLIQQLIFRLFDHFSSSIRQNQEVNKKQAMSMRIKMASMNLHYSIKNRLYSMLADDELYNVEKRESQFKGPYLYLFQMFIDKKQINYRQALQESNMFYELSNLWLPHFDKYMSEVSFTGNYEDKLLKGIYIYCVTKKLNYKDLVQSKTKRQEIIKDIYTQVSLLLGIIFSGLIKDKEINIWFLKLFLKETNESLANIEMRSCDVIKKYIPIYQPGQLINLALSQIQKTFKYYIEMDDLQTLEREFSFRKICVFDWSHQKQQKIFHCVRYYVVILKNLSLEVQMIQEKVHSLFNCLVKKRHSIYINISYYNYQLYKLNLSHIIIKKHLMFLLTLDIQIHNCQYIVLQWLGRIQNQSERIDFSLYIEFVCLIGEQLLQNNKLNYMQIFITSIKSFYNSILIHADSQSKSQDSQFQSLHLFYIISQLIMYNRIDDVVQTEYFLLQVMNKMKIIFRKNGINPSKLITQNSKLNLGIRLIQCCNFLSETRSWLEDASDNDRLTISSWLDLNWEKTHKFEVYNWICKQLEEESDSSLINAFECAGKYDRVLFEIMIRHNYSRLINAFRQKKILSAQQVYKMLSIAYRAHKIVSVCSRDSDNGLLIKEHYTFFNLAIGKINSQFPNKDYPFTIYELVLKIYSISIKSLKQRQHIYVLLKGVNYFKRISYILSEHYGKYLYVTISMLIEYRTKENGDPVDFQNVVQTTIFANEIRMFMEMGLAILEQAKKNSYHVMSICHGQFFMRLVMLIIYGLQQSQIKPFIIQKAFTLRKLWQNHDKNDNPQFKKQIFNFDIFMQGIMYKAFQSSKQYSLFLMKCISAHSWKEFEGRELHLMQNISNLIQLNKQLTINSLVMQEIFIKKMTNKSDKLIVFIKMAYQILTKIEKTCYYQKKTLKTINTIIKSISTALLNPHHVHHRITYINYLKFIHFTIDNSILSTFGFVSKFKQQFTDILKNIDIELQKDRYLSEDENYLMLNAVKLQTEGDQTRQQNFSLWSLLRQRQKLHLLEIGLKCYCSFNGMTGFRSYDLVAAAVKSMKFLAANMNKLGNNSNKQSIRELNVFLNSRSKNLKDVLYFEDKVFSLNQLSNICHSIGFFIKNLTIELTSNQITVLESFDHTTLPKSFVN